jgi:hypothetical protein
MTEYKEIQYDTESNPELTADIKKLQDLIEVALLFAEQLQEKHSELQGWEMVVDKLNMAGAWAMTPLEIWEDEDETETE